MPRSFSDYPNVMTSSYDNFIFYPIALEAVHKEQKTRGRDFQ
jgi:hypothetical protein